MTLLHSASALRHDYKPGDAPKPNRSRALRWFAVGLGLPLVGVALFSLLDRPDNAPPPPTIPGTAIVAAISDSSTSAQAEINEPVVDVVPATDGMVPEIQHPHAKLSLTIKRGDTLDKLFRKNDLNLGNLAAIAKLKEATGRFRKLKPGDTFEITHDGDQVLSMYSVIDLTSALSIERADNGYTAKIVQRPVEFRKSFAYGVIDSSLFESAAVSGLSDAFIMNLAGIFAWDIDFVLDIRNGDNFYVEYQQIWQDDKFVKDGDIIAAEFNNDGRTVTAIRFVDDSGRVDYYTPDGHSLRKAFIRAPVDFTRISSNFNPNRMHPILNTIRPHQGVDYAAPKGTPIKAAGDGKVIFRGVQNGYGNVVILKHGGNITTLYAHMSRFSPTAKIGMRVRQGQTIGYVGSTGLATANHLHFEYRINGVHRNPRTVKLPQADPIAEKYRSQFLATATPIMSELEQFKTQQLASAK